MLLLECFISVCASVGLCAHWLIGHRDVCTKTVLSLSRASFSRSLSLSFASLYFADHSPQKVWASSFQLNTGEGCICSSGDGSGSHQPSSFSAHLWLLSQSIVGYFLNLIESKLTVVVLSKRCHQVSICIQSYSLIYVRCRALKNFFRNFSASN